MKLMALACLSVAALARPDKDSTNPGSLFRHHLSGFTRSSAEQLTGYKLRSSAEELAAERDRNAQITRFENQRTEKGAAHSFAADNGLEQQETIELRTVYSTDEYGQQTSVTIPIYRGSFRFQQPDGTFVERRYTTDETGHLRIEGDDLPKAPVVAQVPASNTYQ